MSALANRSVEFADGTLAVRDHGGELEFGQAPGGAGTRFTVTLPASSAGAGPCVCSPRVPAAAAIAAP